MVFVLVETQGGTAWTGQACGGAKAKSPPNPDHPEASQTFAFGDQTVHEMFIGYFTFTDAPPATGVVKSGGG